MQYIDGDGFSVEVIRSARRKTMAIQIRADIVSIRIPEQLNIKYAQKFVLQKSHWIKRKLAASQINDLEAPKQFIEDESFLFLGESYPLKLHSSASTDHLQLINDQFQLQSKSSVIKKTTIRTAFINWYQQQAEDYLRQKTKHFSTITGLNPSSIVIKSYKARWGSCNIKGDIQFNWKIIQAPNNVVDYLLVHELCHLPHHNHSPAFWQLVALHCPDFKQSRQWLKNHGQTLMF